MTVTSDIRSTYANVTSQNSTYNEPFVAIEALHNPLTGATTAPYSDKFLVTCHSETVYVISLLQVYPVIDYTLHIAIADAKFPNQSSDALPPSPSRENPAQVRASLTTC
jgi:hypothetical protein